MKGLEDLLLICTKVMMVIRRYVVKLDDSCAKLIVVDTLVIAYWVVSQKCL